MRWALEKKMAVGVLTFGLNKPQQTKPTPTQMADRARELISLFLGSTDPIPDLDTENQPGVHSSMAIDSVFGHLQESEAVNDLDGLSIGTTSNLVPENAPKSTSSEPAPMDVSGPPPNEVVLSSDGLVLTQDERSAVRVEAAASLSGVRVQIASG
jgi:hypothetical protein